MAARDIIHDAVKQALIKDGWVVTDDPYIIEYERIRLSADLAAERTIAAEKAGNKIVVEIKSFVGHSPIQDLKVALGQYILYLGFLEIIAPDRNLYLAVDFDIYKKFLQRDEIQLIMNRFDIRLLVVDKSEERVEKWIN